MIYVRYISSSYSLQVRCNIKLQASFKSEFICRVLLLSIGTLLEPFQQQNYKHSTFEITENNQNVEEDVRQKLNS